jgi:hypothetical protein
MAKGDKIELQQPLHVRDGTADTSVFAKEETACNLGNEHDQADMLRLRKKQKLDRSFSSLSILRLTCVLIAT